MVETVDSVELAEKLNKAWFKNRISKSQNLPENRLKIKIQVNTSQEKRKEINFNLTFIGFLFHRKIL
jgi:uncharacterized pyridoxal phosphate-containing UPF0001 family protein